MRSWTVMLLLALSACGGGKTPEAAAPKRASAASPEAGANEEPEAPTGPRKPSCADGSCTVCGDGVCPHGFYCETSKRGNSACAWVPACVEKPTCACLAPFVKGCTCEDAAGAAHVTCK